MKSSDHLGSSGFRIAGIPERSGFSLYKMYYHELHGIKRESTVSQEIEKVTEWRSNKCLNASQDQFIVCHELGFVTHWNTMITNNFIKQINRDTNCTMNNYQENWNVILHKFLITDFNCWNFAENYETCEIFGRWSVRRVLF